MQGDRTPPDRLYRVSPRLVTDPSIEQVARQIDEWIKAGKLAKGEQLFSPSIDVAHYLAWFAPDAKSFVDSRWRLFLPKLTAFVAARQAFAPSSKLAEIEKFVQTHGITGVIIVGTDEGVGAARLLWTEPERFPFRAIAGRVTYFGVGDAHPELKVDAARLAFAPRASLDWQRPPYDEPKLPTFWDAYLHGGSGTPAELYEGTTWLEYMQVEAKRQRDITNAWGLAASTAFGSALAAGNSAIDPLFFMQSLAQGLSPGQLLGRPSMSDAVAAGPVLSVRELRLAQSKARSDPRLGITLADAYRFWALPFGTTELQTNLIKLQRVAALRQAMSLLEHSHRDAANAQLVYFCADQLASHYFENRQFDLGLDAFKQVIQVLPAVGATEQEYQQRTKHYEQVEQQVRALRNQYELAAERDTPAMRFRRAVGAGLPGEALTIIKTEKGVQGLDPFGPLNLLLQIGRAEEAQALMQTPFSISSVPPQLRNDYRWLKFHVEAACGDYPAALAIANEFITEMSADTSRATADANATIAALAVAADPIGAPGLARVLTTPVWFGPLVESRRNQGELHNMKVRQGLIALQAGDTRLARQALREALDMRLAGSGYTSQDEAVLHKTAEYYESLLRSASDGK